MIQAESQRLHSLQDLPNQGTILALYKKNPGEPAVQTDELKIDIQGIVGDSHCRPSHPRTGREKTLYPKNTFLRENRQWFAVSPLDVDLCTQQMGVTITPELLCTNLLIGANTPYSLSKMPRGTYLLIAPPDATEAPKPPLCTLVIYAQQLPCIFTGNIIADTYQNPALAKKFIDHCKPHRGIVGSVEYPVTEPATIRPGYKVFFRFPTGVES